MGLWMVREDYETESRRSDGSLRPGLGAGGCGGNRILSRPFQQHSHPVGPAERYPDSRGNSGHVAFASDAGILFEDRFSAQATIESQMDIPIESLFSIPLDFDITLPVNATMRVEQEFEVAMDVPIQFELSPRDLSMGAVSVDLDTEIFIDDEVEVELLVPIDATIAAFGAIPVPVAGNLPVKARVPIR